jgi:hypothetical protein
LLRVFRVTGTSACRTETDISAGSLAGGIRIPCRCFGQPRTDVESHVTMYLLESWAATWDEDDRVKFTGKYDQIFPYMVLALLYCLLQIFQLALFVFAMFLLNEFRYKREDCSMDYDRIVRLNIYMPQET